MEKLELSEVIAMALTSLQNGGMTRELTGKTARYVIAIDEPLVEMQLKNDEATLGQWLDVIMDGQDKVHEFYNLEYLSRLYGSLALGTWHDKENAIIEFNLNVLTENLHHAYLLAVEFKQRFIYDLKNDEAINVEELWHMLHGTTMTK